MINVRQLEQIQPNWVEEYLNALGLAVQQPSYDFLESICTAQLTKFPFENISKLIYYRDQRKNGFVIPPIEVFVRDHFKYQFGGTCYSQNSMLLKLLRYLGFTCYMAKLGADHIAILVEVPEFSFERVYIDCGAAAPFFKPVRFEADPNNVSQFGSDQVFLRQVDEERGIYHFVRYRNGEKTGKDWLFDVNDRYEFEDFSDIVELSNLPNSTFMSLLRCQLWQLNLNRNLSLVNNILTFRYLDGTTKQQRLYSVEEIETVLDIEFGLPNLPVRDAVKVLNNLGIDIFAEQEVK